jgi:hypothetical protein
VTESACFCEVLFWWGYRSFKQLRRGSRSSSADPPRHAAKPLAAAASLVSPALRVSQKHRRGEAGWAVSVLIVNEIKAARESIEALPHLGK